MGMKNQFEKRTEVLKRASKRKVIIKKNNYFKIIKIFEEVFKL